VLSELFSNIKHANILTIRGFYPTSDNITYNNFLNIKKSNNGLVFSHSNNILKTDINDTSTAIYSIVQKYKTINDKILMVKYLVLIHLK